MMLYLVIQMTQIRPLLQYNWPFDLKNPVLLVSQQFLYLFIYFVLLLAFLFSFSSCGKHHLWLSTVSLSGCLKYLCEMGSCLNNLLTSLWSQKEKSLILTNFPGIMLDDIFSPVRTCSTMVHNFLINILLHFAPCYNCIIMF